MHYAINITQKLRKLIRSLNQKQNRDQNHLFIAEGRKLCSEVFDSEFTAELLVVRDSPSMEVMEIVDKYAEIGTPVYNAPKHQFDQMSTMKSPEGIVAVVGKKNIDILPNKTTLILDGINDPGNLGTIIRTAEWFGFKQVALGNDSSDHFNPKAVRSSMGAVFKISIQYFDDLEQAVKDYFPKMDIYGASLSASKLLVDFKPKGEYCLVFGNESHGISKEIQSLLKDSFKIEGIGQTESLNVSVAAGISLNHFSKFI